MTTAEETFPADLARAFREALPETGSGPEWTEGVVYRPKAAQRKGGFSLHLVGSVGYTGTHWTVTPELARTYLDAHAQGYRGDLAHLPAHVFNGLSPAEAATAGPDSLPALRRALWLLTAERAVPAPYMVRGAVPPPDGISANARALLCDAAAKTRGESPALRGLRALCGPGFRLTIETWGARASDTAEEALTRVPGVQLPTFAADVFGGQSYGRPAVREGLNATELHALTAVRNKAESALTALAVAMPGAATLVDLRTPTTPDAADVVRVVAEAARRLMDLRASVERGGGPARRETVARIVRETVSALPREVPSGGVPGAVVPDVAERFSAGVRKAIRPVAEAAAREAVERLDAELQAAVEAGRWP